MRQVIKHRDIRLLNMIRRTDPVIPQHKNIDYIKKKGCKYWMYKKKVVSLQNGLI